MLRYFVIFSVLAAGSIAYADDLKTPDDGRQNARIRPAWQYDDEERLAMRFDPQSIRARAAREAAASRGRLPQPAAQSETDGAVPNVVVGRHEPELFLPFELFNELVWSTVILERRADHRARLNAVVEKVMTPAEFWTKLEAASAPFSALLEREHALAQTLNTASPSDREAIRNEIKAVQQPQCASRIDALRTAVNAIGRPALYQVLYEGIAPTMARTSSPDTTADGVRFIAGGCR